MDGSVDFYRGWEEYQYGFGNLRGEHWLGKQYMSIIFVNEHAKLKPQTEHLNLISLSVE